MTLLFSTLFLFSSISGFAHEICCCACQQTDEATEEAAEFIEIAVEAEEITVTEEGIFTYVNEELLPAISITATQAGLVALVRAKHAGRGFCTGCLAHLCDRGNCDRIGRCKFATTHCPKSRW